MNRCCREAKDYLVNKDSVNSKEIKVFIDKFNNKIESYSFNGLSSYLLSCVELSLQLSGIVGYTKGEVVTKWLKGHALFLGGHYKLANKSFEEAMKMASFDNVIYSAICSSFALNKAYIGDFAESLSLVKELYDIGEKAWASTTLSSILKFKNEKELSYSLIENSSRETEINNNLFCKVSRLLDLNNLEEAKNILDNISDSVVMDNDFYNGYKKSIDLLINARRDIDITDDDIEDILKKLGNKSSFYHYIDGLLNIAEIYLDNGNYLRSCHLLELIVSEKRELVLLDNRLYNMLVLCYKKLEDSESSDKYFSILHNLEECCSSTEIEGLLKTLIPATLR